MQEKNIETLVINKIESQAVYDAMEKAGKINSNELYLVGGGEGVTGVKGAKESTYRTGEVNLTAANIGALPEDTAIPSKTSDLTNDSGFLTKHQSLTNYATKTDLNGKVDKIEGKDLSTNDFDNTQKSNLSTAYTHSQAAHAPSNAERNTIVTIKKNGTALSPDSSRAINITVPTKVSELTNDSGYLTSVPVTSVNSKTGAVSLTASDVGAAPSSHTHNYAGSSSAGGAATSANKVNKSMTVKLNGGTTEGTNQFTFDGSAAKSVNITPSGIGAAASSHTHSYLPLSGGTLTGDLTVGSSAVRANGYIEGTWLKTTAATSKAGNFATIDGDGWIYYRTPAETLADIGAASASHNHSAANITSGTLPITRGGTGSTTAATALTNLGAQAKAKTLTLSLTTAGWSSTNKTQTKTASGVTKSNVVIISPTATSQDAYSAAGVKCTAQAANRLTFTCDTVPMEALNVNVVIL